MKQFRFLSTLLVVTILAVAGCEKKNDDNNNSLLLLLLGRDGGGDSVINIAGISGVHTPVLGEVTVATITETEQYTGTVMWDGGWAWSSRFGGNKAYTATITLTAKPGYTLTGVTADFFTVAGATSDSNPANSGVVTAVFPPTASVSVGDSVLGGKVAYILADGNPGYVAGEQRGLIAAAADQDGGSGIIWAVNACKLTAVPEGTETALGTGSANTDKIITQNGAGTTYAAGIARSYNGGGYTDWYLPSQDELNILYINRVAIGGFASAWYWSSSEYNDSLAWVRNFTFEAQSGTSKDSVSRVRVVRAF